MPESILTGGDDTSAVAIWATRAGRARLSWSAVSWSAEAQGCDARIEGAAAGDGG